MLASLLKGAASHGRFAVSVQEQKNEAKGDTVNTLRAAKSSPDQSVKTVPPFPFVPTQQRCASTDRGDSDSFHTLEVQPEGGEAGGGMSDVSLHNTTTGTSLVNQKLEISPPSNRLIRSVPTEGHDPVPLPLRRRNIHSAPPDEEAEGIIGVSLSPMAFQLHSLAFFSKPEHRSLSVALELINTMKSAGHGTEVAKTKEVRASRGAFAKKRNLSMLTSSSSKEARRQAAERLQDIKQTLEGVKIVCASREENQQFDCSIVKLVSSRSSSDFSTAAAELLASTLTHLSAVADPPFERYLHTLCKDGVMDWPPDIPRTNIFSPPAPATDESTEMPPSDQVISHSESDSSPHSDSDCAVDSEENYAKKIRQAIPSLISLRKKEKRRRKKAAHREGGVNALPFPRPRGYIKLPPVSKSQPKTTPDLNTLPFPFESLNVSCPLDLRAETHSDDSEKVFNFSYGPTTAPTPTPLVNGSCVLPAEGNREGEGKQGGKS